MDVYVAAAAAAPVRIVQGEQSLECGEAMQLTAEAFDTQGAPMPTTSLMWRSSHPEVLHVDARGTIMALAGGVATVSAHLGDVQGTTRVEVREAPVGAVTLTLSESQVDEGARVAITLAVTDVSGLPRSSNGLAVVTDAADIATVETDPLELVTHAAGRVRVRVVTDVERGGTVSTVREPWAVATVEVRPVIASIFALARTSQLTVGGETTARAQAQDGRGAPIDGEPVTWSSSDPRVATVSATGAVRALAAGTATLTASVGDVRSTIDLVVQAVPLAALRISTTAGAETFVGSSVPYVAHGSDANGANMATAVRWSLEPASAGRISAEGVVQPLSAGTLTVIATAAASDAGAPIEARTTLAGRAGRAPRVSAVQLSASSAKLRVGGRQALAAELVTEAGVQDAVQATWRSSDETVAQVSSGGELSAVAVGSTTVTVRVGTHESSMPVEVSAAGSKRMLGIGAAALAAAALVVVLTQMGGSDTNDGDGFAGDTTAVGALPTAGGSALGGSENQPTVAPAADGATTAADGSADTPPSSSADAPAGTSPGGTGAGAAGTGATGRDADTRPVTTDRPPTRAAATGAAATGTVQAPTRTTTPPTPTAAERAAAARQTPPATAGGTNPDGANASTAGATPTPPPAEPAVVRGPNDSDMSSLAFEYTARLTRGDFRTGELSSFFSRTTSEHKAAMIGGARRVSAQGDAMQVDVTVELERTMGSGAIQRRYSTVRLLLRGGPGAAVIETATASALRNAP